ncbi:CLUMA_CG016261, isoform B [Clunio marinus]|uniref:CLUMA_CG016261, isoform B n=1 Tax=Clunio marinus TaxID=568069 RepID=A0A1J1IUJ4_9DIPT|nr:CLUMA_CG016261, isoform B [Clunio marinus]
MKEFSVFPRERFVYENVLRSFEDIWLERAGEEIQFGPRDVKYETDPYEIIVLDDLKAAGYEMLNRKVGLNMEQTKMLLTKLAKFHAASAIRYQKDGIIQHHFDRSTMPLFPTDGPMAEGFEKMSKTFEDSIRNYGGHDDIADKISRWNMKKLLTAFVDIAKPMRCGFQILNHGDTWLNNMMFKFDKQTNSAVDVRLIDYQMSFWGSPTADLLYFLLSSVEDDIKVDHFDEFIDFYHEQLTASLKALKYDQHIPTLTELHIDLLEKGFFACSCITGILFVVKFDSDEEINMEMFFSGDDGAAEKLARIYNNDNFKKALKSTGKNENYVSVLYRAKIKIEMNETKEKKVVDVIIKALLTTIKEMKEFSVFPRERFVYENVLRSFEDIWLERVGEEIQFGPRDVKYETDPYEIIVLDDLKAAGYEMLNRKVGLNMEQTKMLLTKLAKFHAASAIRYQKDGTIQDYFDRSKMPPIPEDSPFINSLYRLYDIFEHSVRNYGGFEDVADKISRWNRKKLLTTFIDVASPMRCGFKVMNHGDIWLNNMMFKIDKETNSATDVLMIDYQMPFWGSPSADLIYFLLSSVEDDIKVDHFDEFVDFYHEQLTASLKALKYDQHIPTLTELHIDLLEKGFFAMATSEEQSEAFLDSDTICDDFFIEIVENKLKISRDEFRLQLVILSSASGQNENYVSVLYRAKIKIEMIKTKEKKVVDVIIKALLTTIKEMKEFSVFPRERFVYENVLKSFEDIWLERADEEIQFGPRDVKYETDPYEIIVLDDLKAAGYEMLNRKVGLNMEEAKIVLMKLAKFHAAGAVCYQEGGAMRSYFDDSSADKSFYMMTDDNPFLQGAAQMLEAFVDSLTAFNYSKEIIQKFSRPKKNLFTSCGDITAPMQNGFRVLNHADLWINNAMFKFNEEREVLDVSFIDYQTPSLGSPSFDLLYFLLNSVADDIKTDYFDDFVCYYHENLTTALRKLKYQQSIPTLTDLHIDMLENKRFACYCLVSVLPIIKLEKNEEIGIEVFMGSAEILYRANIKIEIIETKEKRSVQVIVKVLLVTMKEMKEFSVFPRERFVYENVLRSFEDIWLERTGEEIQFGPRDVKYETDPYEIIVLDDLKAAGYEMLNRKVGLNMEQTKMLLTKLAKFHAASAIRYQKDGMIKEYFDRKVAMKPMMAEGSPIQNSFKNIYYEFRDGVKSFDGCEVYANKISNWDSEKLFLAFSDIAEPMQCGFQILNHGDTWLNNMMFKLDNETNSAVDVRLIDYQISFWGSPSADLIYFLLTSVEDDIKVDHFDEFVDFYHEQLTASLKALKYDEHIPTLKELKDDLLEKKIFDELKLRLVMLSPATGKNENFVSVLLRAKIKVEVLESKEKKSVDVIIKALLTTMKEMKEFSVFPRERFIYENVLKSFEDIWLERAGEEIQFGPRDVKYETDPYEIIVLDDLKAAGYEMLNRKVGLNMEQTKMLLTKLAKFHAASAIRYQKDGIIQNYFDRKLSMPPFPEDSPLVVGFRKLYYAFRDAVMSYGDCDIYAEKIAQWDLTKLFSNFIDIAEPMESSDFKVLNHGDIWLNNMMFKLNKETNSATDVLMIDYQGPFWGSPAGDLLYFLISSVEDDIKIAHFDNLIKFYHDELTSSLNKLRFNKSIPTLKELNDDMEAKGFFACACIMFILFVVKYDSNEEISIESIMTGGSDEGMFERIYRNDNYKKSLKLWLSFLNDRGYLDSLIIKSTLNEK